MAYAYDSDSHVTGLTYSMGSTQLGNLSYQYDPDGHATSKGGSLTSVALPQAVSGNVFNADNEMTQFGAQELSYDSNGNLTGDGTNTYAWDARNHLAAITGGVAASFVYDGLGRRASKTMNGATQFAYDGLNPVQELDGASPPNVTANLITGLGIDEYFSRTESSGAMSFLRDALGSTIALADSTGALNTQYTYQPFGATTMSGPANANPYQFTRLQTDARTVLFTC